MDILYLFLPIILWLGIITSYSDIRFGKIKNKHLLIALFAGLFLWGVLISNGIVDFKEFLSMIVYAMSSLFLGFFLWLMKMWSAGDAKLYSVFILLIPLSVYNLISGWPIVAVLTNIFFPILLFLIASMFIKSNHKQRVSVLRKITNPKILGNYFLFIFSLIWLINLFFGFFGIQLNYLISIIVIIGVSRAIEKLFQKDFFKKRKLKQIHFLLFLALLRIVFQYELLISLTFWFSFLIFTGGYVLIRMFLFGLGDIFTKPISFSELKEGMIIKG